MGKYDWELKREAYRKAKAKKARAKFEAKFAVKVYRDTIPEHAANRDQRVLGAWADSNGTPCQHVLDNLAGNTRLYRSP